MRKSSLSKFSIYGITIVVLLSMYFMHAYITEFRPNYTTAVSTWTTPDTINTNYTLTATTWNIGYAGLGNNMDFFYDGGKKMRDSQKRTAQNLKNIKEFVAHDKQVNFLLLQEVDIKSHRSHKINELNQLIDTLKQCCSFAINYQVSFVPIPIFHPMQNVQSGIATFSRPKPSSATRYSYPGEFGLPSRLFNLKRCMLVSRYCVSNSKELILINTHNSAFDKGSLKEQEMEFLRAFAINEYNKGNYVVIGGDWNQSPPNFSLMTFDQNYVTPSFTLRNIENSFMPNGWQWAYDPSTSTNRYLNQPYKKGETYEGILDFFLTSPNVKVISSKTTNLNYCYSDHNPVTIRFQLTAEPEPKTPKQPLK